MENNFEHSLKSDHDELDGLLAGIFGLINESDFAGTFLRLDVFWARLAVHIRAEHLHLFPAVCEASRSANPDSQFEELPDVIAELRGDHEHFMKALAALVKLMRSAKSNERDILEEVRENLIPLKNRIVEHNRIEEERIYNVARSSLLDVETISAAVRKELVNLPPRLNSGPIKDERRY